MDLEDILFEIWSMNEEERRERGEPFCSSQFFLF